jgi:Phage terminase large subunit (GpA)
MRGVEPQRHRPDHYSFPFRRKEDDGGKAMRSGPASGNLVERIIREGLPVPDRREIWEWAAENVDFGNTEAFKGPYNVENVPWTRELLRAFNDPKVRKVSFIAPPQDSGKTKAAEVCMCSRICRQPAKMAFNGFTNESAKKWADTRWKPMMTACKPLLGRLSDNRHDTKKMRIVFPDNSFLIIQGASEPANRESDSIEVQINDECQFWLQPWLSQMHNRLNAFRKTSKILQIGLGGTVGTEWHQEWLLGNQGEWSHHCPACERLFQYRFNLRDPQGSNIHFDKTKVELRSDGMLDFTNFRPTVFVTCPQEHCCHRIDYDEILLAKMNRGGKYVSQNPSAPPSIVSLHVNAFAIGREPWSQIIEPWIKATVGRSVFATSLLQDFIQKKLAEFWEERPIIVRKQTQIGNFTRREMKDPAFWPDEWIRLFSMDNQEGAKGDVPHRWFVCRAFSRSGASRLIDCGRINEWDDCNKKALELGVPPWSIGRPGPWIVCDRWHKPQEVDTQCALYKWYGMMGQDTEEFLHPTGSEHEGEKMLFSDVRQLNLSYGHAKPQTGMDGGQMVACYYLYAKQKIEDILAALRGGKAETWEAPRDIEEFCPQYFEHMNSHQQVMESTKNGDRLMWRGISGAPDHLYDCETQLVVLGLMAGVFKR